MTGELSPASVYVSLLPVVEACVVVAVPGRVGEVRDAADEPEAVDLDPGVLARRLDTVPYSLDLFYPGIQVTESPPRMVTSSNST